MKSAKNKPRVLLVWPGTDGAAGGNFGVPQLVGLASYVAERHGAAVTVVDLVCERALAEATNGKQNALDLKAIFAGPDGAGYDVIGVSCYASYDYLKVRAIADVARAVCPEATLVAGGYHASARPAELLDAADGHAPFDVVVVGEGEKPLGRVVEAIRGGAPLRAAILGPDPIEDLDALPPADWSLLDRYKPILPRVASQVMIYLSRGCPFDCAFCMERAKREVSWRAFSVDRAIDEVRRLAAWLDLTGLTVYVADALFGMRPSWRRELLARLAAERLRAEKIWLLVRVDMIDDDDLRLFAEANVAPGFGLESGDPGLLGTIRKAGRLNDYLDRMRAIAEGARRLGVPWGANVIVGHPGETEETLRTTAAYLRALFLDPNGTTGFLSVDPFRLYPGSPIDDERAAWEARFGAKFHRPAWWNDGDQAFLSEWIDPSEGLDYRRRAALSAELLDPIAAALRENFRYEGSAAAYFRRAIDDQVAAASPRARLFFIERFYAWNRYLGRSAAGAARLATDGEAADLLRGLRERAVAQMADRLFPAGDPARARFLGSPIATALVEVRRERFVPLDRVAESSADQVVALDATGRATMSALHAYERAFRLAKVGPGSRVLDLGGGAGYGAALLRFLAGDAGQVVTIELDPKLAARAKALLDPKVTVIAGDAIDPRTIAAALDALDTREARFDAVIAGFAVEEIPRAWGEAVREGGVVVAPVALGAKDREADRVWGGGAAGDRSPKGEAGDLKALDRGGTETQRLCRATRRNGALDVEAFDWVRYVTRRRPDEIAAAIREAPRGDRQRRALPRAPGDPGD